jgi:hypothetical protein
MFVIDFWQRAFWILPVPIAASIFIALVWRISFRKHDHAFLGGEAGRER